MTSLVTTPAAAQPMLAGLQQAWLRPLQHA
jgi:hypothetical protein